MGLPAALLCVFGLLLLPDQASGFGEGAPISSCLALYPKHRVSHQSTPSPFSITVTPSTYNPSQTLTVVIEGDGNRSMAGLALAVRRPAGSFNDEELLGSFDVSGSQGKLQTKDCLGGTRNFLTHANPARVPRLEFNWTAPSTNAGPVEFRATLVESKEVFWLDVKRAVLPAAATTPAAPSYENPPVSGTLSSVDLSTCGSVKSCLLHPPGCATTPTPCTQGLTFARNGSDVTFEMFAATEAYVSLGLSNDTSMGNDQTVSCVADGNGQMEVQHGYNPDKYNFWQYRRGLRDLAVRKEDGKVSCRFTMPQGMTVYTDSGSRSFPFTEPHFLMLAWGSVYQGTTVMRHHHEKPLVSSSAVSLQADPSLPQWATSSPPTDGSGVLRATVGVTLSSFVLVLLTLV